jgi:hypothetical protein
MTDGFLVVGLVGDGRRWPLEERVRAVQDRGLWVSHLST